VHRTADGELELAMVDLPLGPQRDPRQRTTAGRRVAAARGRHPGPPGHTRSRVRLIDLVEIVGLGLGVSLLPPAAIRTATGRVTGLSTDPPMPRELILVTPRDRDHFTAGRAFLELLNDEPLPR
jgi:DNA-binding transcriptional LysR family regulator